MSVLGPVYLPASDAGIKRLALAFARNNVEGRLCSHAAILFRPEVHKPLKILHLIVTGDVKSKEHDVSDGKYCWAIPNVPLRTLQAIAWFCERVAKEKPKLRYWFEYEIEDALYDTGQTIELREGVVGLTCSTFVLAVLANQGFRVLDLGTWSNRSNKRIAEDDEFEKWLIEWIETSPHFKLAPEAVSRKDRIPCIRFTPEDVIGGCRVGAYPVEHSVADAAGREVRRWMDEAMLA